MSPGVPRPVLITGGAGLLGSALIVGAPRDTPLMITIRNRPGPAGVAAHRVDLAEPGAVRTLVGELRPGLIIHTAYGRQDLDRDVVASTSAVAAACADHGVALVHCSSDVIFDGLGGPYDELAGPSPVSPYGDAKAEAEAIVTDRVPGATIIRTSLLIQADPPDPASAWVVEANRRHEPVTLFVDEYRCPVSVDDVAAGIWQIAALPDTARRGVWHLVGPERLSRVELGELLARRFELDRSLLLAAPSASVPGPRPLDVTLTCGRAQAAIGWEPRRLSEVLGD